MIMHIILNTRTKTITESWIEDFVNEKTGTVTTKRRVLQYSYNWLNGGDLGGFIDHARSVIKMKKISTTGIYKKYDSYKIIKH